MSAITAIVQARTGSERLSGKVLSDLDGRPVIAHLLDRLGAVHTIDSVILAVPEGDSRLIAWADGAGVTLREGDEHDVLGRYAGVVREQRPDVVVRVTGDCPLLDPHVVDRTVAAFVADPCDYLTTSGYPRGLGDVEVTTAERLLQAAREAEDPWEREHVMPYLKDPERFTVRRLPAPPDLWRPDYRLCVDEHADLEAVRAVCALVPEPRSTTALVEALDVHPELVDLNAHVLQRS